MFLFLHVLFVNKKSESESEHLFYNSTIYQIQRHFSMILQRLASLIIHALFFTFQHVTDFYYDSLLLSIAGIHQKKLSFSNYRENVTIRDTCPIY